MKPNTNPDTGIAYGVIAVQSLDDDVGQELWYGSQARDLSYEAAIEELKAEVEREAESHLDNIRCALAERGGYTDREYEAAFEEEEEQAFDGMSAEEWVESQIEHRQESIQIEEPTIEGTYEGVTYRIDWLGGAPLLWVFKSPHVTLARPCSPCVPGAGDLDNVDERGIAAYDVPADWRRTE